MSRDARCGPVVYTNDDGRAVDCHVLIISKYVPRVLCFERIRHTKVFSLSLLLAPFGFKRGFVLKNKN